MKNSNLLNRLLSYSHEKQSPQRFARYAAILIMLLTLGVGQMWAATDKWNVYMTGSGSNPGKGSLIASFTSGNDVTWISTTSDAKRFYLNYGEQDNNNWFNGTSWSGPASAQQLYKYENYEHGMNLTPVLGGVYRFSTWDDSGRWFQYQPFIIVGNGSGNWLGGIDWSNDDEANIAKSTGVTYSNCAAGEKKFRIVAYNEWDQLHGYSQTTSDFPISDGGDNSVQFTTGANATITISFDGDDISLSVAYPIIYKDQGDEAFSGSHGVGYPTSHTYGSATALDNPTKNYYDFAGWYTTSSCSGEAVTSLSSDGYNATITLYAKWTPKNYTITYKDQGDVAYSGSNEGSLPSSYTYGTGIASLTDGVKSGYRFDGWFDNPSCTGSAVTSISSSATGNKTFYAQWLEVPVINDVELSSTVVTGGTTITATPDITDHGQTVTICWNVLDEKGDALASQPTFTPGVSGAVSFAAPTTPGAYKLQATLREGSGCGGDILDTEIETFDVESQYTVSITNGIGSSTVGTITTATVTADAATAGMKFAHWNVTGAISYTSGNVNSRTITFTASSDISLTAVYVARTTKKVYFAKPSGWSNVYAYAWQASSKVGDADPTNRNAAWHGVDISSYTETVNGTTYYYYQYYTDNNGEDDDKSAQNSWDKIVFNDNGSNKTSDLTIADGHFYHKADGQGENGRNTATVSGSASAEDWYVCGYWNASTNDWGFAHPINLNGTTSGNVTITGLTASTEQQFKIYRASTDQWFKWTGGPSEDYNANKAINIGEPMTLREYNDNRNTFTSYATEYLFTLDITSTSNPVLTVVPSDNTPYSATLSKNGHGSLSVGTGAITLKQYIPTTITATPEPGYRFKQWNVSGVSCSSTTSTTATFTASAAGGTIEAEFTNEGFIYLDKSAIKNSWGGTPYVYFYSGSYWDKDGKGSGSKSGDVTVYGPYEMSRIGDSQIWYYDYHTTPGTSNTRNYIAFNDHSQSNYNNFVACLAIYRGDFYPKQNMFVVKDYKYYYNKKVKRFITTTAIGVSIMKPTRDMLSRPITALHKVLH